MDNLQNMFDIMNKKLQEQRSKEMFTLGNLIDELEKYPKEWHVHIEPFRLVPCSFSSYRGYYSDLSLTYVMDDKTTVGELLNKAKEANGKTFTGYKGGEFEMDKNTPLWVSNCGECSGVAIAKIERAYDGLIEIHCYKRED